MFHVEHSKQTKQKTTHLKVKDHSVSGELFELQYNIELDMLETFPRPQAEVLSQYYKSESYISHTNAKRNWFEKCYHFIRRFAIKKKLNLINKHINSSKNLLDIGCGTGSFLEAALNDNWNIIGIEPNKQARAIANEKCVNQVYDADKLNTIQAYQFDVITLWHVLEHIPNLEEQMSELYRLLKPNGTLIIAVPNFKSYDANHYKEFWAAYDVPRHLWHFSQTAIKKLFAQYNFKVVKTKPMIFDAFYVSLLSEKYKSGNMNMLKGFFIGLFSNVKALSSKEYSSLIYILKKAE